MEIKKSFYLFRIIKTQIAFLLFRPAVPDVSKHFIDYLIYILTIALVAGVGRYWDHPNAQPWQYFGLGSVAYIFILSLFLYVILLPLKPKIWSFKIVLVFVGLTSLPAVLYAIPVERIFSLDVAQSINAWFLAVVAVWRVALYAKFLRTVADFHRTELLIAILLPLSAIVAGLSALNLEHAVFEIMAGNASPETAADSAYIVVLMLSILAYLAFPVTLGLYLYCVYRQRKRTRLTDL